MVRSLLPFSLVPSAGPSAPWLRSRRLLPLTALLLTACAEASQPEPTEEKLAVDAVAVELPAEGHSLEGSKLRWRAGFDLNSEHQRFGGFSGMLVDGDRLLAISDRGWWWRGRLEHAEDGTVTGVLGDAMWPISDLDGAAVEGRGRFDAEELVLFRAGLAVAFEGEHRLHFYRRRPGEVPLPSSDAPSLIAVPAMADVAENGGLEPVTTLDDGRLVAFTEDAENADGLLRAFVGTASEAKASGAPVVWRERSLQPTEDFKPTAAATLAEGDVLLVERSFNPLRGVRIRLSRFPASDFDSSDPLRGEELGRLLPPVPVDNVEAVDVVTAVDGSTLIYLLADDNFRSLQRTLLIQLELVESEPPPTVSPAAASTADSSTDPSPEASND
ncbi:MAG: esterase-like activity of phytase family protein [Acidobacteriota bacterium]